MCVLKTEDVRKKLIDHDLRVTQQRIVIYKMLYASKEHPTVEMIYNALKEEYPSLSLATVYKTLDIFQNQGLVRKLKGNDDSAHYDADLDSHNHLICTKTNKIIDFNDPDLIGLIDGYLRLRSINNFNVKEIQLNIIGETIN